MKNEITIELPIHKRAFIATNRINMGSMLNSLVDRHVMMFPITEEIEKCIDKYVESGGTDKGDFIKNDRILISDCHIKIENIIDYGVIDFDNEEDLCRLDRLKLFEGKIKGSIIPTNYNYNEHNCITVNQNIGHTETTDNIRLIKYKYALIGKPKRVIIATVNKNDVYNIKYDAEN